MPTRPLALAATALTGMAGLVYEVSFEKYLAILLGSHSEATAAVLALFLGGLAGGYALFGRLTSRAARDDFRLRAPTPRARLLRLYGAAEAGIGVWALLFPELFELVHALSVALPAGGGAAAFAVDVALCALLILPPTLLMGATIPVLTQALARDLEDATRIHASIYAINTAGAVAGSLAAGYSLIPWLGLAGVLRAMSVVNLAAGAVFVWLASREREGTQVEARDVPGPEAGVSVDGFWSYAMVALLAGFAMMALQTVVIRVGGLALGASQQTFSMVVAAAVACIAVGSFAVSALRRIPSWMLLANQWTLVAMLAFLYGRMPEAPYYAHVLRAQFRDFDSAFPFYSLLVFGALLVALGPALVLSGAVLPLLFHELRRRVGDLGAAAGRLYSWNTFGSLLGAILGGHVLLHWFDLHHVFRIALGALILGAALLAHRLYAISAGGALALFGLPGAMALWLLPPWDPYLIGSAVIRERRPQAWTGQGPQALARDRHANWKILFADDDPTSTVMVVETLRSDGRPVRSIFNNNKSDGSAAADYQTMALAGILPSLFATDPTRAFVIGWGTGVSAGELAALDSMQSVTVAEISSSALEAAPLFDAANLNASLNPKIRLLRSDAYRALLRSEGRYDVILSEPSNPWMAGVEMLYSEEFLAAARDRLTPGGVYVQWYHEYESDRRAVELVLRTVGAVFGRAAVWYGGGPDYLVLGFREEVRPGDLARIAERAARPDYRAALGRSSLTSFPALLAHELLDPAQFRAVLTTGPLHTLTHPRLSDLAARAFFRGARAELPLLQGRRRARGPDGTLFARYVAGLTGEPLQVAFEEAVREGCARRSDVCQLLTANWRRSAGSEDRIQRAIAAARASLDRFGTPLQTLTPPDDAERAAPGPKAGLDSAHKGA
jgi:predicted membrane-bound spermidine synthase